MLVIFDRKVQFKHCENICTKIMPTLLYFLFIRNSAKGRNHVSELRQRLIEAWSIMQVPQDRPAWGWDYRNHAEPAGFPRGWKLVLPGSRWDGNKCCGTPAGMKNILRDSCENV